MYKFMSCTQAAGVHGNGHEEAQMAQVRDSLLQCRPWPANNFEELNHIANNITLEELKQFKHILF